MAFALTVTTPLSEAPPDGDVPLLVPLCSGPKNTPFPLLKILSVEAWRFGVR
jgi:hypothetical protein